MKEALKNSMMDINNLAKAYKMVKETLSAEYGEEFLNLTEEQQALATGKVLADLLGI
jgi:hypothetical protein